MKYEHAIHFLIDGARVDILNKLIAEGKLPNISRYIIENGSHDMAFSCFPSTTGPAFTPIMTGSFPGTCNIPGVRWFDRHLSPLTASPHRFRDYFSLGIYRLGADIPKNIKTMHEHIPHSATILGLINRGLPLKKKAGFFTAPWLFYKVVKKNDALAMEEKAFQYFKKQMALKPQYLFYYFPIVDLFSHKYGSNSKEVLHCYKRVDHDIGRVVAFLKEKKLFDKTLLMLMSDHGHEDVKEHFDTDAFVEKYFSKTLYVPGPYKTWRKAQAINMVSGNSMTHIYVKSGKHWRGHHDFDPLEKSGLVDGLLSNKAIDFVLGKNHDGTVVVKSRRGKAYLKENHHQLSYTVDGSDPFGYGPIPKHLSFDEALTLTADTSYPDALVQCTQIFRAKRAGDLICAASPGYDLREGKKEVYEHRSSHGSLHRAHMSIPFFTNAKLKPGPKRSADIFAVTLAGLDIKPLHTLDGKSHLEN
ncbi:alkaline phosphatase family protein [bacterium]|nr:alkaline phosphatase family protein [bacterium]